MNSQIESIYKKLSNSKYDLYLVGGCVRDFILNTPIEDIDLVTNATPDQMIELFENDSTFKLQTTGKQFAVIRVYLENGPKGGYEIATYRKDITNGRKPEVDFDNVSIEEDAQRRDLTINALYMHPITKKILDFTGGLKDIESNPVIIRTPGNPEDRFAEDPLRILRVIRYKNRYNGEYSPEVVDALSKISSFVTYVNGIKEELSQERIIEEFQKGLNQAVCPLKYIEDLSRFKLLSLICRFNTRLYINYSKFRDIELVVAELVIGTGAINRKVLYEHLVHEIKLTTKQANRIVLLYDIAMRNTGIVDIKNRINATELSNESLLKIFKGNKIIKKIIEFKLTIKAKDLIKQGHKPGPKLGEYIKTEEQRKFMSFLNK
jgi:tRNA nucleotidyltransferase/poly(A) polymerase